MKIILSDAEWMQLIDGYREGLPVCCANISALRDCLIKAARNGGDLNSWYFKDLHEKLRWFLEGHELTPLLEKICEQVEFPLTPPPDKPKVGHGQG